jgi:transcriptional regulator with XRE-family HTH domain
MNPLQKYREANELSQAALAKQLGCSAAKISHIENGRRRITPMDAISWERSLGMSRADLCPDVFGTLPGAEKAA